MWLVGISLIIVLLIIFLIQSHKKRFSIEKNTTVRTSDFDGYKYKVSKLHEDQKNAANVMAILNHNIIELLRVFAKNYKKYTPNYQNVIDRLLKLYNPDNLVENSVLNRDETSYVVNKGEIFALCLRNDVDGLLHTDINTLMFVVLHELSHIGITSIDHNQEFWATFKFILLQAASVGLIEIIDYHSYPTKYCSMIIDSNPALN